MKEEAAGSIRQRFFPVKIKSTRENQNLQHFSPKSSESQNVRHFGQNIKNCGQNFENDGDNLEHFDENINLFGQNLEHFGQNIKNSGENLKEFCQMHSAGPLLSNRCPRILTVRLSAFASLCLTRLLFA